MAGDRSVEQFCFRVGQRLFPAVEFLGAAFLSSCIAGVKPSHRQVEHRLGPQQVPDEGGEHRGSTCHDFRNISPPVVVWSKVRPSALLGTPHSLLASKRQYLNQLPHRPQP
jgi:hypothetical protein